nr:hypothetical protein CFP56_28744 [Quercus suber]
MLHCAAPFAQECRVTTLVGSGQGQIPLHRAALPPSPSRHRISSRRTKTLIISSIRLCILSNRNMIRKRCVEEKATVQQRLPALVALLFVRRVRPQRRPSSRGRSSSNITSPASFVPTTTDRGVTITAATDGSSRAQRITADTSENEKAWRHMPVCCAIQNFVGRAICTNILPKDVAAPSDSGAKE